MISARAIAPELAGFGPHLAAARLRRGLSQGELAGSCGLAQSQVSLLEAGRRPPTVAQLLGLARALDVPLQQLLGGSPSPGEDLASLSVELRGLGLVDLWVADAKVPGAARPTEEVLALACAGLPDPRVIGAIPALLAWNPTRPGILRAFARASGAARRLAWLADIALAIDHRGGFPGGCRRGALERFVAATPRPPKRAAWDDLGSPSPSIPPPSPIWRRWKIGHGSAMADFERRALDLASARAQRAGRPGPGAPAEIPSRTGVIDGR